MSGSDFWANDRRALNHALLVLALNDHPATHRCRQARHRSADRIRPLPQAYRLFADAVPVLEEERAISVVDESEHEERWVTIGLDSLARRGGESTGQQNPRHHSAR